MYVKTQLANMLRKQSRETRARKSQIGPHREVNLIFLGRCPFSICLFPENMRVLRHSLLPLLLL